MLRKRFLLEHRKGTYSALLLMGKLHAHLREVDERARELVSLKVQQLASTQGLDESLKARDEMAWLGTMNAIKAQAVEMVLSEIVYC